MNLIAAAPTIVFSTLTLCIFGLKRCNEFHLISDDDGTVNITKSMVGNVFNIFFHGDR